MVAVANRVGDAGARRGTERARRAVGRHRASEFALRFPARERKAVGGGRMAADALAIAVRFLASATVHACTRRTGELPADERRAMIADRAVAARALTDIRFRTVAARASTGRRIPDCRRARAERRGIGTPLALPVALRIAAHAIHAMPRRALLGARAAQPIGQPVSANSESVA